MNRLTSWLTTVIVDYRRELTDAQRAGTACALCGEPLDHPDYRVPFGWIGLPPRRRAYACKHSCTLDTVPETEALFRSAIPARQDVSMWDMEAMDADDEAWVARLAAQPKTRVEIVHADGTLTTRPLPVDYAERIAAQAQRLGLTAMIDEDAASAQVDELTYDERDVAAAWGSASWDALYCDDGRTGSENAFEHGAIPKTVKRLKAIARAEDSEMHHMILSLVADLEAPAAARSRRITADALDASIRKGHFTGSDELRATSLAWIAQVRTEGSDV